MAELGGPWRGTVPACNSGETFLLYSLGKAVLEDNMKSCAPVVVAGILSCFLTVGCFQNHQETPSNPPATSYQVVEFELRDSGSSQKVRGASVTAAFFQNTKVAPLLGRSFLPEEYSSSRQQVAIVSHRFWQQQFGGDPRVIGMTMHLNQQNFTVIGIMPAMFDVPSGIDIWVPRTG